GTCRAASDATGPALDGRTALVFDPADEHKALALIQKNPDGRNSTIRRDWHTPGRPIIGVSLLHAAVDEDLMRALARLPHLQSLYLGDCRDLTVAVLKELAQMKQLREL